MPLPNIVHFENLGPGKYTYRVVGKRPPKKGEYYLSGAIVQAYQAPNDLTTAFMVVEPLQQFKLRNEWVPI